MSYNPWMERMAHRNPNEKFPPEKIIGQSTLFDLCNQPKNSKESFAIIENYFLGVKDKMIESFPKTLQEIEHKYNETLIEHIKNSINKIEAHIEEMKNYISETQNEKEKNPYHSCLNIENGIAPLFIKIKDKLLFLKNNSSQKSFLNIISLKNIILSLHEKLGSIIGIRGDLRENKILKPYSDILDGLKNIFILPPLSK